MVGEERGVVFVGYTILCFASQLISLTATGLLPKHSDKGALNFVSEV